MKDKIFKIQQEIGGGVGRSDYLIYQILRHTKKPQKSKQNGIFVEIVKLINESERIRNRYVFKNLVDF